LFPQEGGIQGSPLIFAALFQQFPRLKAVLSIIANSERPDAKWPEWMKIISLNFSRGNFPT
jgi:hypothetical protein